jgi:cysteine synthase
MKTYHLPLAPPPPELLPQQSRKKKMSAIRFAQKIGKEEKDFLNLFQYGNPGNPEAYEQWFAPQIYQQLDQLGLAENPLVFCAAMGTCGTVTGCGKYFKENNPKCHIVGSRLAPGEMVPGVRDEARLKEVKIKWQRIVDKKHVVEIGRDESYKRSMQLSQIGIAAGPSTGLALAGLIRWLKENPGKDGTVAVFPLADSYALYADKLPTIASTSEYGKRLSWAT